jgi:hypothetical protein
MIVKDNMKIKEKQNAKESACMCLRGIVAIKLSYYFTI